MGMGLSYLSLDRRGAWRPDLATADEDAGMTFSVTNSSASLTAASSSFH